MSRLSTAGLRERRAWLAIATAAAASAASLIISLPAKGRGVRRSARRDVKIEADALLDRHLINYLSRCSPLPILTEESGAIGGAAKPGGYRWIVDPLDGSLNHARGIPLSAISIALWRGEAPVIGVVLDVNRDEVFSGIVGVGAWLNGAPITTSRVRRTGEAVLCTGFPIATDFSTRRLAGFVRNIQRFRKVRLLGSAALSLAYVACGRADAYQEQDIKIWDVAAGVALVRAAGGKASVIPGRLPLSRTVVASSARLQHHG